MSEEKSILEKMQDLAKEEIKNRLKKLYEIDKEGSTAGFFVGFLYQQASEVGSNEVMRIVREVVKEETGEELPRFLLAPDEQAGL